MNPNMFISVIDINKNINKYIETIKNDTVLNQDIIKVAKFFYLDINYMYYIDNIVSEKLCELYTNNVLFNYNEYSLLQRLIFQKFINEYAINTLSYNYWNGSRDRTDEILPRIQIGNKLILLNNSNINIEEILDELKTIAETHILSNVRYNAIDILLNCCYNRYREIGTDLLNNERYLNNINNKPDTIINDSQNVHNSSINESVLQNANKLIIELVEKNGVDIFNEFNIEDAKNYLLTDINKNKIDTLIEVLNRIQYDTAIFKNNITIYKVFISIYYKCREINTPDIKNRFIEELLDSYELCSTGHLSRLINVLSGFFEEPSIKISDKDRYHIVLSNYIQNKINNETANISDELYNYMMSNDNKILSKYYNYLLKYLNDKNYLNNELFITDTELIREFAEFFTKNKNVEWIYNNDKLEYKFIN